MGNVKCIISYTEAVEGRMFSLYGAGRDNDGVVHVLEIANGRSQYQVRVQVEFEISIG